MRKVPATEFMTRNPETARPDWSLARLVERLIELGVRGLVVTNDEGEVMGVVTETDLFLKDRGVPFSLEKVPTLLGEMVDLEDVDQFEPYHEIQVREVMTRDVVTVEETATFERVALLMLRKKVTLVPVISAGQLVGEVRRFHILRLIYCNS
jgi:CBS domain-containing protein